MDLAAIWQSQYEKLKIFKMANGHCNVPNNYEPDPAFARWICTQRTVYRRNQMHEDRKVALESLGFEWRLGTRGRTWDESLIQLKEYKEKHGHCFIPSNFEDSALRNWVVTQRQRHSKGSLSAEQIQQLESVGFAWSFEQEKEKMWDFRFHQLSQFVQQHGHCGTLNEQPDLDLLDWISRQHNYYFAKKLSPEKVEKLLAIGFVFNRDSATATTTEDGDKKPAASNTRVSWRKHYSALIQFKETHGHTNVPADYEDSRLARWVGNQRKLHSKGQGPTAERIQKLEAIGFDWTQEQRRLSFGMPPLKPPPVAAAAAAANVAPENEADAVMAAAEGLTAASRPPKQNPVPPPATPIVTWARAPAPAAQTATQKGVQQMAVGLEVARAKLDTENKQLKKANQKLESANQTLTKRLAEAEAAFRKETQELREKLQYYDEILRTQSETLQNHGEQLQRLSQTGPYRHDDVQQQQATTLQTQENQISQLAQQVQDMRQMQYTLQHQVGVQNLTYRL